MLGQLAKVGTGIVDLLLDHTKLKNAIDYSFAKPDEGSQHGNSYSAELSAYTPQVTPYGGTLDGLNGTMFSGAMTPAAAFAAAFTPQQSTPFNTGTYISQYSVDEAVQSGPDKYK